LQLKLFVGEYVEHAPAAVRRLIRTSNIALELLTQRSKIYHIQVLSWHANSFLKWVRYTKNLGHIQQGVYQYDNEICLERSVIGKMSNYLNNFIKGE